MNAAALCLLAILATPAAAEWHISGSLGYPLAVAGFETVDFQSAPVLRLAVARRGAGALQPCVALQYAARAEGTSREAWFGTIPDYQLEFTLFTLGGEFATRDRKATLALSPGIAFVHWTEGAYTDFLPNGDVPAHTTDLISPAIAVEGALHIPVFEGLDLEPGLAWVYSLPVRIDGTDQGHLHQVQVHIGIGF